MGGSTIFELVSEAKAINTKVVTVPRLLILLSLENLGPDGATYKELVAGLEMKDGILFSNLNALARMGCVKSVKVKIRDKKVTSFSITNEGLEALSTARMWLKKLVTKEVLK